MENRRRLARHLGVGMSLVMESRDKTVYWVLGESGLYYFDKFGLIHKSG